MKNIIKFMFLSILLTTIVWSCSKDEKKVYFEGGTAPVLTVDKSTVVLTDATKANTAMTFSWTNPNYMFNTGVSSQTVYYILEIDTTGANFTSPHMQSIAVTGDLTKTLIVGDLNSTLANSMFLKTGMAHKLDVRVKATMINSSAALYSNVLNLTVTPFMPPPKVVPPASGNLWIVGACVAGLWDASMPSPYDVTQKFTAVTPTLYTLTIFLTGGVDGYKLIQAKNVWGTQFHAIDGTVFTGGDFEQKDAEPKFPAPAVSGTYKITIDFQYGKYYVEKV
jgi:starch-binding outer membrane protein SusE/F